MISNFMDDIPTSEKTTNVGQAPNLKGLRRQSHLIMLDESFHESFVCLQMQLSVD